MIDTKEKEICNCGKPETHEIFNGFCPVVKINWFEKDLAFFWKSMPAIPDEVLKKGFIGNFDTVA